MSRKRYTPEQIIGKLREAEVALAQDQTAAQVCRTLGVAELTFYRWHRGHGAHNGKTPMDQCLEMIHKIPLWEEVGRRYDPAQERIQEQDYQADLQLRRLTAAARSGR